MQEDLSIDSVMPIGRFSEMTRLSIKALRLYDEMGLLRPAQVDPSSGYRYYSPGQANQAEAIRRLRGVDMPLEEIGEILSADPEVAEKLLNGHRDRLSDEMERREKMLGFLSDLIEGKEQLMPYEVAVKRLPDQDVASLREHVSMETIGDAIGNGFAELAHTLQAQGTAISGAPFIVYHDVIDEETDGDIEICIPVAGPVESAGRVEPKTLSGGAVASTIHRGPYREIPPAYHALSSWISQNGHSMTGPPREVYLNDPTEVSEEEILTEVDWPIDGEAE